MVLSPRYIRTILMKRILLTTALCATLPFAAHADDIVIRADLAEATVFGAGAEVSRVGTAVVPAGRHRLLIAVPDLDAISLPQIAGTDGVRFGPPTPLYNHPIAEGLLDTDAQASAREAVEAAEDAMAEAQDALTQADAAIRAIETQQGYIAAILRGGESGVAMPDDPAQVALFLSTLGAETARLAEEALEAQVARRDLAEALTDAQRVYSDAARALQVLSPFGQQINAISIDVVAAEETDIDVVLAYFTPNAGWRPSYELNLDTEASTVAIDRFVTLQTYGPARWQDVDVIFSTATPDRAREPSALASRPARLREPVVVQDGALSRSMEVADSIPMPAPMVTGFSAGAPAVVVEEVAVTAAFEGLSVSYPYPEPISVSATGEVLLAFDTVDLRVEQENRAVPRWDETAFRIAMVENDSGAPILPGEARFYRDGALMGEGALPLIPAGADAEMAFGALDHLQLTWIDRSLAEGDRGLFVTSSTQARQIAFGVENTGTEAESVRILYATPFAEQEDLELDLTLSPRPSEEDIDDQRGIHAWDLTLAAGAEQLIEMEVEFTFPEGQILDWRP